MLVVKLRDAMEAYHRRTGERMTYVKLSERTGIAVSTLRKIGSELGKHTTLTNIEKFCRALSTTPGDLLELIDDLPKAKPKPKRKSKK